MKIHEAAVEVLRRAQRPMTTNEIYEAIVAANLAKFGAKEPIAVVNQTLRKKSDDPRNKGEVLFKRTGPRTFVLAS